jgi:hypothetical protein
MIRVPVSIGCRRVLAARVVGLLALGYFVAPAYADTATRDPAGAEALFKEARAALQAGQWDEACAKFDKSMDLDPSPSTLANIGQCHEHAQKLASAWYDYQRALKLLVEMPYGERRREELADRIRAMLAPLEPRVPTLRVTVDPQPSELEVLRNGESVPPSALGERLPVDPGEYEIVARAPGFETSRVTTVVSEGNPQEVTLRLEATRPASAPPGTPRPGASQDPARATRRSVVSEPPPVAREGFWDRGTRRTAGLAAGAVGLAMLGTAGYFAVRTLSLVGDAKDDRYPDGTYGDRGIDRMNQAGRAQTLGFVFAGAGVVFLGAGVTLYVTALPAPKTAERTGTASVESVLAPRGVVAGGIW